MHEISDVEQKRDGWAPGEGDLLGRYLCRCGYATCWYKSAERARRNIEAHIRHATEREQGIRA